MPDLLQRSEEFAPNLPLHLTAAALTVILASTCTSRSR
jgi:hypothetical protein